MPLRPLPLRTEVVFHFSHVHSWDAMSIALFFKRIFGLIAVLLASSGLAATTTYNFSSGWNLAGNSASEPMGVPGIFGDASKVTSVWKWHATNSRWAFYSPALADGGAAYAAGKGYDYLNVIEPGEGFWINAAQPFSYTSEDSALVISTTFQRGKPAEPRAGWNLMSVGDGVTPGTFNASMGISPPSSGVTPLNLTTLWAWDNVTSKWFFYSPDLEARGGAALTDYIASKGYQDFTVKDRKLTAGTGFWVNSPVTTEHEAIEQVAKQLFALLSDCSASSQQQLINLWGGSASVYNDGRTMEDFFKQICTEGFGKITLLSSRLLALVNDKAVLLGTIKFEKWGRIEQLNLGLQKVSGQWRIMANQRTFSIDPAVTHELVYSFNDSASTVNLAPAIYQRYLSLWSNRSKSVPGKVPAKLQMYFLALSSAASQWEDPSTYTSSPGVTLYQAPATCNNLFTLDASLRECNSNAYDSDYPAVFSLLEKNVYSLVVIKALDANNKCMNCNANGIPESANLIGQAKTAAQLFGPTITLPSQTSQGTNLSAGSVSADAILHLRQYFNLPSDSQLAALQSTLMSKSPGKSVSLGWQKETRFKTSPDDIWGGTMYCSSTSSWVDLDNVGNTPLPVDEAQIAYNNPSTQSFANARYVSLTIENIKYMNQYRVRFDFSRGSICTP